MINYSFVKVLDTNFMLKYSECRKVLLLNADGMSNAEIASSIGARRNTVATFMAKYIAAGIDYALNDSADQTVSATMKKSG